MSISGSLHNALSGLTAASRQAQNVSANIANASTPGYARREVELSARTLAGNGSGVAVTGTVRIQDPVLLGDRRLADAALGDASARASFFDNVEGAIGLPDNAGSLTALMAGFESALVEAASRPDSEARLQTALNAAQSVAAKLNAVSDAVQGERLAADQAITLSVDQINDSLRKIADLNAQILRFNGPVTDDSPLIDQRQALIDGIADLVPLREVPRENGTVALFTPGGAILLDGLPATLGFTPANVITADMSLGGGTLSGLTINGKPVSTDAGQGPIAGGRLAGLFQVRDVEAPQIQARVDAVARDLIERFESASVDPTLNPGDPGLFTDAGAALNTGLETGLAGRISVNPLADPQSGGALWRIRDGLGAVVPGAEGDATLLNALTDALAVTRLPATGGFAVAHSATGLASDLLSGVSVAAQAAQSTLTYRASFSQTLIGLELENGVDTDAELQRLLLVEQSFAANARVITTIDEMIQTLLGL